MSVEITGEVITAKLLEQEPFDPDLKGHAKELYGFIEMSTENGKIWFRTPKIRCYGGTRYKFPKKGNDFLKLMSTEGGPDILVLIVRKGDTITVVGRPKSKRQLNYVQLIS
jgi:hypothetical protein